MGNAELISVSQKLNIKGINLLHCSELLHYAEKQYGVYKVIRDGEIHLLNPYTQNELFCSRWYDYGEDLASEQRFFIKCGKLDASCVKIDNTDAFFVIAICLYPASWNSNWIGLRFSQHTDPKVVNGLFALALADDERCFAVQNGLPLADDDSLSRDFDSAPPELWALFGGKPPAQRLAASERIRKMYAIYNSVADVHERLIDKQFYQQSKLMADYEDDLFWTGDLGRNLRVYCELNLRQLRGYFAWRTSVRRGVFRPAAVAFAYIYIYELLNGLGAASPEDGFRKMQAFEAVFINSDTDGHKELRRNLYRWMLDYAIINNFPVESAQKYHDGQSAEIDAHTLALKNPSQHTDDEIFAALCYFGEKDLGQSPIILADADRGKRLFAGVWRYMTADSRTGKNDVFGDFFGKRRSSVVWRPFAGAIYCEDGEKTDTQNRKYELNENHVYTYRNRKWNYSFYNPWKSRDKIRAVFHEAERVFRQVFKLGHALRFKDSEDWITPYASAAAEQELRAEAEAARPKISINFAGLEQIRREADVTKESLLLEEELKAIPAAAAGRQAARKDKAAEKSADAKPAAAEITSEKYAAEERESSCGHKKTACKLAGTRKKAKTVPAAGIGHAAVARGTCCQGSSASGLDDVQAHILTELLQGRPIDGYIKQHRLMPSLVAETVNAAFYEEIGDNVLECEGETLTLVEDYTEDIRRMINII